MQKLLAVEIKIRDENNDVVGLESAYGPTTDEGQTVVVNNGYLTRLLTAPAEDIQRTLIPPPTILEGAVVVSRIDDAEANTSTIVFDSPVI